MEKTFLVDASIVSVFDSLDANKAYLGDVLAGQVIEDETFRFRPYEQIVTSIIVSKSFVDNRMEVITHNGNCYSIGDEPKLFKITTDELAVIRFGQYSPETILALRKQPQ
ncbi:MAG: hypothetical protein HRU18_24675 [Pseudoalteromonas sp.]|uniref:Uncharacterized protein n=1 Tax=Neptunicella marina TaxID=2125989 RepID=A0A8J6M0F6_9ALTE|nr:MULTISPECIES: hypothetical protein [Alteromonadales]MBC3767270.1 hypothetical protein [Neptunicella marina]NRA81405.1 hypothetical protein [Pseudoalteromonas sp.]